MPGTSNQAMIGKLVSWVYEGRDSIWTKWINSNYLKGEDWSTYTPTLNSSWVWRRICSVKHILKHNFPNGQWVGTPAGYTTASAYVWLRGRLQPVSWHKQVWNKWVLPRHQFLGWIYAKGGLRTNDKLIHMGLLVDADCHLCGQFPESNDHLFFHCEYSKRVIERVAETTHIRLPDTHLLEWCRSATGSNLQKGIKTALLLGTLYNTWLQRNNGRIKHRLQHPNKTADMTVKELKRRLGGIDNTMFDCHDKEWLMSKNLM
ncbi:hypothetical protein vseg_003490 [Gypsophila vaccaria]